MKSKPTEKFYRENASQVAWMMQIKILILIYNVGKNKYKKRGLSVNDDEVKDFLSHLILHPYKCVTYTFIWDTSINFT